ncbi:GbsR/MarR family transcriptional regulator [Aestuariibaculum sediminum]|uniref:Transcriptional regulator n=1 Tax=Aestuariibaculum sediminum TaxID=2770637 RepID=A0A8J6UBN1_9FLAO|nr:transcriptional regulator [Aestuariibaculum sediminum]MBD0831089.1 transcriptional regulator [Aestuariibaculum sediminum]
MMTCKERSTLIEKLGVFLETKEQLAPVAARIMAYAILKGKSGTTFEDLVVDLAASKSTISTHLNHLQDLKKIEYFTKPGDRKKYFVIKKDTILIGIDNMVESWNLEKEMHLEIKAYKEKVNKLDNLNEEEQFDLEFHDDYLQYLEEATQSILKLKSRIIERSN